MRRFYFGLGHGVRHFTQKVGHDTLYKIRLQKYGCPRNATMETHLSSRTRLELLYPKINTKHDISW